MQEPPQKLSKAEEQALLCQLFIMTPLTTQSGGFCACCGAQMSGVVGLTRADYLSYIFGSGWRDSIPNITEGMEGFHVFDKDQTILLEWHNR